MNINLLKRKILQLAFSGQLTSQKITILSKATLESSSVINTESFEFEDETSSLILNGAKVNIVSNIPKETMLIDVNH